MQNLGGQTKSIRVFSEVAYAIRNYVLLTRACSVKVLFLINIACFGDVWESFMPGKLASKHSKIQERTRSHLASC